MGSCQRFELFWCPFLFVTLLYKSINCLPTTLVLSRNLLDRSSTDGADPQGYLDDRTSQREPILTDLMVREWEMRAKDRCEVVGWKVGCIVKFVNEVGLRPSYNVATDET